MNDNTVSIEQTANTPTPEASGGQSVERMFTQDEVNRIVSERLARERAKMEPSPADEREAELKVREARLSCKEFIAETGYPVALLDILETSDLEKFKAAVEKLDSAVSLPSKNRMIPRFATGSGGGGHGAPRTSLDARIGEAFKPPEI